MSAICRDLGLARSTVYAAIRARRGPPRHCSCCGGEIPEGHRLTPISITVPGAWSNDRALLVKLLREAGVPIPPEGGAVASGRLVWTESPGAVRWTWEP